MSRFDFFQSRQTRWTPHVLTGLAVALGLWLVLGHATARAAVSADKRPNIVVILADDLGWADLSCYGSKFHKTPHLDRLAQEGMRFTHGYASCPVCSPTRAALMTGLAPARLHLTDWLPGQISRPIQRVRRPNDVQQLSLEYVTLAEMLKERGYRTAHIGKWHLGGEGFGPLQQGFDHNIGGDHTGTPLSYFAPFQRNGRFMPGLEQAEKGEYLTDRFTTEAVKFLDTVGQQPFFLYVPHNAVHTPLTAKADLIAKYSGGPDTPGTQHNPVYAAMLHSLDESVGRIVAKLDELKLRDQTLIVFTSDNGGLATLEGQKVPATINSPLREGKGYLYEGGIRVPWIIQWSGKIAPGVVSQTPIQTADLYSTIAELVGGNTPDLQDGISLVPELLQTGKLAQRPLYWHYPHYANQGSRPGGAIREGDFKLIEFYDTGRRELFDVVHDVGEGRNLIQEKADLAQSLATKLQQWREQIGAQSVTPNPDYVPNPQADDGSITLTGRTAEVHGVMLRYEPLPHKATLGYWVRAEDWADWEFTVKKPGKFQVELWQGCGNGSGGSTVECRVAGQSLTFTVEETGHFQKFVPRNLGEITLSEAGRFTLELRPVKKPGVAVMDVPRVILKPVP